MASGYDIASFLCLVPVTYFGGRLGASKPRIIAWGIILLGLGSLTFAFPHFLVGPYRATMSTTNTCSALSVHNDTTLQVNKMKTKKKTKKSDTNTFNNLKIKNILVVISLFSFLSGHTKQKSCELTGMTTSDDNRNEADNMENLTWTVWIFFVAQLLHGAGASPLFTLGVTYIDENVSKKMSSVYLGKICFFCFFVFLLRTYLIFTIYFFYSNKFTII